MKEIQIAIKLQCLKDINEKLLIRKEFSYYIEIYFSSNRMRSKCIRKYPQDKTLSLPINQTLLLKHYTGNRLEFWFRSEMNDMVLGAFEISLEKMAINSEDFIEENREFCLSEVLFATLNFTYQIKENNIDKPIIIERDEDLLKPPEEDKEELERKRKEKERIEQEELEAQRKLLPKDSLIHLTNIYVKDRPFF